MSDETIDPELQTKLVLSPAINMTRDDVTEAIQEWVYRRYGANVPNFMVQFDEERDIANMKCQDIAVQVRLHQDDVREILNRFEGDGKKDEPRLPVDRTWIKGVPSVPGKYRKREIGRKCYGCLIYVTTSNLQDVAFREYLSRFEYARLKDDE